jgi:hypothetical protein
MTACAGLKYINYKNRALSIYDEQNKSLEIISKNQDLLHELCYLSILTMVGEALEKKGCYRLHGLSFKYQNKGIIVTADSGVGKTSLFLDLIKSPDIYFFSDDVTLINKGLRIMPFPLRIGVPEKDRENIKNISLQYVYELSRRKYGKKILLDINSMRHKVSGSTEIDILLLGKRWDSAECKIKRVPGITLYPTLFKNFVIGIGLPQLIEYLDLNVSFNCPIKLFKKAMARLIVAVRLIQKCETYIIYLGTNTVNNIDTLIKLIQEQ